MYFILPKAYFIKTKR